MKTLRLRLLLLSSLTLIFCSEAFAQTIDIEGPFTDTVVPAGDDFACTELENCWDMSQRRDVQYEEYYQAGSVSVSGGIWTGVQDSTEGFLPTPPDPQFDPGGYILPLFGGFLNGSSALPLSGDKNLPLAGLYRSIDTSKYTTLSFRMNHSDRSDIVLNWQRVGDEIADDLYPTPDDGLASAKDEFEISSFTFPIAGFNIYSYDLSNLAAAGFTSTQGTWDGSVQSLRIEPSINASDGAVTRFDWIRIVDPTSAPNHTITWSNQAPFSFGVTTVYVDTDASGFNGTPMARFGTLPDPETFTFPTAILPPGEYYFYVETQETDGMLLLGSPLRSGYTGQLRIVSPPSVSFLSPTRVSGGEYSDDVRGKPWNMNAPEDIRNLDRLFWPEEVTRGFVSESFINSGQAQFGGAFFRAITSPMFLGENPFDGIDPLIDSLPIPKGIAGTNVLLASNPLAPIDPNKYRYLTFRMRSGVPGQSIYSRHAEGHYASAAFGSFLLDQELGEPEAEPASGFVLNTPLYEGWQTYSIDLWDNEVENNQEWRDFHKISQLSFLPLETRAGVPFDIDWVMLNEANASVNNAFEISLALDDADEAVFTVTLEYASENSAPVLIETIPSVPAGVFNYTWDTTNIPGGVEYDIIATVADSAGQTRIISRAPVFTNSYVAPPTPFRSPLDYNGDGISDQTVYRPSDGVYYQNRSDFGLAAIQWVAGDGFSPVQGDFDGDGTTDIALVFEFFGYLGWYITFSSNNTVAAVVWGFEGDEVAVADYNGDGRDQVAVFRNGTWYILNEDGRGFGVPWGLPGDIPVPADYDGDGSDDIAVYRPDNGEGFSTWFVVSSAGASNDNLPDVLSVDWGLPGDIPVPADWSRTLDGIADFGVYRPATGTWFTRDLMGEEFDVQQWGLPFIHTPVLGDFNGDGYPDFSVFEADTALWFHQLRNRDTGIVQTGLPGDRLPRNIR